MEQIINGYCRAIDSARMVLFEDGEADCSYAGCAYRDTCPIGQELTTLLATSQTPHKMEIDQQGPARG